MEGTGLPVPVSYSPGEVVRLVSGQANALFAQLGTLGIIEVVGVLGPVRESRYPIHYDLELRDSGGGGDRLLLNIPKDLGPEKLAGRQIKVRGFLKSKKGLTVALDVSQAWLVEDVSPEVIQEELALRSIFQKPNAGVDTFPQALGLRVSCIHGINSQVAADFQNQVSSLANLNLQMLTANFLEPASIVEAIRKASGAVVFLIRGGGNEGDFEVFNRPAVLESWRAKEVFKVTALGHTQNTTLLDRLSHKVCDTPTAAGKYLFDQVKAQVDLAYWREQAERAAALQAQAVRQAQGEGNRKAEELQTQVSTLLDKQRDLEVERAELQGELKQVKASLMTVKASMPAPAMPFWVWIALPAVAILGVIFGWAISNLR